MEEVISVVEGENNAQRAVRFALYHLYSFAREGTAYSLSPMGLSGLGYNGHVFWDTELWMYPPLLVLNRKLQDLCWNIGIKDCLLQDRMLFRMDTRARCFRGNHPMKEPKILPYGR